MKIKLDSYAYKPTRAYPTDAGLDLYSPVDVVIHPHESKVIRTGVHVQIPHNCVGLLMSKSGLNVKHDITSEGVIDENYTGEIIVKLYNNGSTYYHVHAEDKITQLLVVPVLYEKVEFVEEDFEETERGSNGFGSTGR